MCARKFSVFRHLSPGDRRNVDIHPPTGEEESSSVPPTGEEKVYIRPSRGETYNPIILPPGGKIEVSVSPSRGGMYRFCLSPPREEFFRFPSTSPGGGIVRFACSPRGKKNVDIHPPTGEEESSSVPPTGEDSTVACLPGGRNVDIRPSPGGRKSVDIVPLPGEGTERHENVDIHPPTGEERREMLESCTQDYVLNVSTRPTYSPPGRILRLLSPPRGKKR